MKKLLIVLFVLSVVLYTNLNNETETAKSKVSNPPITTLDLPHIN